MMFQSLIFLFFASGVLCDPYDCMLEDRNTCDPNLLPKDYPDTIEELRSICSNMNTYGNCLLQVYETCGLEELLEQTRKGMNFFNAICNEDNSIYKVIANSLECIAPAARKSEAACNQSSFTEDNYKAIESKEEEVSNNYESTEVLACLSPLWFVTCRSTVIGYQCGSEVKQVVKKILTELRPNAGRCTDETFEEIQPLRETYETVIDEERKLKNIF